MEKEEDLKRYMVILIPALLVCDANLGVEIAYARCHIDWAKKNVETWKEAKDEVDKIEVR